MTVPRLAVLFDVDGTLVDSEQSGHRVAFNQAFAAAGLTDQWPPEVYRELLAITGGEARLRGWFARNPASITHLDAEGAARLCAELHRDKTDRFVAMCAAGTVTARTGAQRLVAELVAVDAELAIATTGRRAWVEPLIARLFGASTFAFMVTGDDVATTKPDPEVYLRCLQRVDRDTLVVAVEDSIAGLDAAARAGVPCVLVVNDETLSTEWSSARLALSGLGDEPDAAVLHDPSGACPDSRLTATTLRRVARRVSRCGE